MLQRLVVGVVIVTVLGACSSDSTVDGSKGPVRTGPMTPSDSGRINGDEVGAIDELAASGAGKPADGHGHSHGRASIEVPLFSADAATFANQWLTAQQSVPAHDTLEKAAALGYVRAAAPAAGVGTHWVRWSQIAQPFDPAQPAMLLFDEGVDPPRLVGYSYWLQSAAGPDGFAGGNDTWHQHAGLCVVNGWVDREGAAGPADCAGTYLGGADLWMLHAWVVPSMANRLGRFAAINPTLCPPATGTPDIARCPTE